MNKIVKKLVESKIGNFYIDNSGGKIEKLFERLNSDNILDQRDIARETYSVMLRDNVKGLGDEQIKKEVENFLDEIEKSNPDKFPREELKRVGFLNKWGFGTDKYPLVKQLPNKNYLIAGARVLEYRNCEKLSSQDILIYRGDLSNEVFNKISSNYCFGDLKNYIVREIDIFSATNYCVGMCTQLIIPSIPVSEKMSKEFINYFKRIEYVRGGNKKLEDLTIGEVRKIN